MSFLSYLIDVFLIPLRNHFSSWSRILIPTRNTIHRQKNTRDMFVEPKLCSTISCTFIILLKKIMRENITTLGGDVYLNWNLRLQSLDFSYNRGVLELQEEQQMSKILGVTCL